jgi:polar amino acid transport system substrate-binding protein
MMKISVSSALLIAFTLFLISPVSADTAEQSKTIHIVADEWPGYTEPGGKGFYFELIKNIFEAEGYSITQRIVPFRRAISLINHGEADIFLADDHPDYLSMLDIYDMTKILHPTHALNYSLVTALYLPTSTLNWSVTHKNNDTKIAWIKGYGYGETLKLKHSNPLLINNTQQGLHLLLSKRIDCYLDDLTDITMALTKPEFKNVELKREIINKRNLYPIFHNNDFGKSLAKIYDQRMGEMIKSGEIYDLYRQAGLNYNDVLKPKEYFSKAYEQHSAEGLSILVEGM